MMHLPRDFHPAAATQELCARLRRLADDLDRIRSGASPTALEIHQAPLLERWSFLATPVGTVIIGSVTDHPTLGYRRVRTSPVWVVDPGFSWARTLSRFYSLGEPDLGPEHRETLQ